MAIKRKSRPAKGSKRKVSKTARRRVSRWVWVLVLVISFASLATTFIKNRTRVSAIQDAAPGQSQKLGTTAMQMPNGERIDVEVARTEREREIGLMNRTKIPMNSGMLFVFPGESLHNFWMKNTLVDLDMIFIGADKKVTKIEERVPRTTPETPENDISRRSGFGQYVLELASGGAKHYGIQVGSTLHFDASLGRPSSPD